MESKIPVSFTAPFPYFGGKRVIAAEVWRRLGGETLSRYVEPFLGSAAVLLARPGWTPETVWREVVNDADGLLCNFWRAVRHDPAAVAHHAETPVHECDLHARHAWLVGHKASLQAQLEGDPAFCDAHSAGWWLWGMALWIGGGFCSGAGSWVQEHGHLVNKPGTGHGITRQRVHLGNTGHGITRQRVHLGDAGHGIHRRSVWEARGAGPAGAGAQGVRAWLEALSQRLRHVWSCCGEWHRVCTPSALDLSHASPARPVGVFLDPPYAASTGRDMDLYAEDSGTVAAEVHAWALEMGDDPRLRLAICGYDEHDALMAARWTPYRWIAQGGMGNQGTGNGNRRRETVWFSPHTLLPSSAQLTLLAT